MANDVEPRRSCKHIFVTGGVASSLGKGLTASSQRFNYDYDEGELKEIGGQVQQITRKVETTHVLFNNNYEDQGQRGARALTNILVA